MARRRIREFLMRNGIATIDMISKGIKLNKWDVKKALYGLKKEGIIDSVRVNVFNVSVTMWFLSDLKYKIDVEELKKEIKKAFEQGVLELVELGIKAYRRKLSKQV